METSSQKRRDFVLRLGKLLGVAGATSIAPHAFAKGRRAELKSVALKQGANGQQKLVFELDKSVSHNVHTLSSPDRIVIDFFDTQPTKTLKLGRNASKNQLKLIKNLRQAPRKQTDFRVVLDMAQQATSKAKFRSSSAGHFLEVALTPRKSKPSVQKQAKKAISAISGGAVRKPMTVAIDAGHGGKDPGAVGRKGTKEKHIALQIAQRVKKQIDRQPGMKAVLIRDGDYYVSLRKRIIKARAKKADLFISIHADANPNPKLTGSSVYILSEKGASSEAARWIANSENSYESKMAGADLHRDNKVLSSLILDLSLSDTIEKSLDVASGVLKELGGVNRLLRRRVESAGFVVLKSPDIPSVLVETAFISNTMEEKRLKTVKYQNQLAKAIFKGIRRYQVATLDQQQRENETQFS